MPGLSGPSKKEEMEFQAKRDVETMTESTEINRNKARKNRMLTMASKMERDAREAAGRARIAAGKKE